MITKEPLVTSVNGVLYIDPSYFLQTLEIRVNLVTEKIAAIGLDPITTERLRGQRLELNTLIQQIKEATDGQ